MGVFMNLIVIASIVIFSVLIVGAFLSIIVRFFGNAVTNVYQSVDEEKKSINLHSTLGFEIPAYSDFDDQLNQARKLAAKKAAATPRGGNLGIGTIGSATQPTASEGVKGDPVTAVKIAKFHGWNGVKSGYVSVEEAPATGKAPSEEVAATKTVDDLIPGVDYPFVEITDSMSPAEKRKARIANAKAKSAAAKALKEAAPVIASPTPTGPPQLPAQPEATTVGVQASSGEPVAGVDYEVIEITDDMLPDEVRKARIANSKAKSAALKAFRESGGMPSQAAAQKESSSSVPPSGDTVVEPSEATQSVVLTSIPKPNYIEISDEMDADEVRKARIQNAKAKSAYKKALKEAGIDPSSIE